MGPHAQGELLRRRAGDCVHDEALRPRPRGHLRAGLRPDRSGAASPRELRRIMPKVSRPTVALTMIVRDEEAMLPACLASVAGAIDELIVVDTGSRDATIAIARAAGAKVYERPWDDDFSAPRNLAIAEATADWVLVLDADERLAPGAASALHAALAQDDFDCGFVRLHTASRLDAELDAVVRGKDCFAEAAFLPRVMRRTLDLRFTGIIHENVGAWLSTNNRRPRMLVDVNVVHLGGVPDLRAARDKRARNIRLLERACEASPDDVTAFGYLAHEFLEAGERKKASAVAERGWQLVVAGTNAMDLSIVRLASAVAWMRVQASSPLTALDAIERVLGALDTQPDLHFIRGCALEQLGVMASTREARELRFNAALASYERALELAERPVLQKFIDGCTGWAAHVRVGVVHLACDRPRAACAAFDAALALRQDAREALLGRVEALLGMRELSLVTREVAAHLDDRPDGHTLAALAAEAAGNIPAMTAFVARAGACLSAGFASPHRRERYFDALAALSLYLGTPGHMPGPMGQLARIAAGFFDEVPGALVRPLDTGVARRVVRHLLSGGRTELVEPLVDPRAEALMPGLAALVDSVVGELERSPA
ncbi:MAG: glycosyltransferase family 2 protein [Myxococcales bacterium]|nr:glycosyltransferase family 2 protein [Myxococcales bacterium]